MKQVVDLQKDIGKVQELDVQVLAVMVDPLDWLQAEVKRRKISDVPVLSDGSTKISAAYGVLGKGMHTFKPNHTFVLIDKDGTVRWLKDYAEMYVSNKTLLQEVAKALGN